MVRLSLCAFSKSASNAMLSSSFSRDPCYYLKLYTQVFAPCCGLEPGAHSKIPGRARGLCLHPAHLAPPQLPPHHRLYPGGGRNQSGREEDRHLFEKLEQQILPSLLPAPASLFPHHAGPVCIGVHVVVTPWVCGVHACAGGHMETVCGGDV